MRLLFSFYLFCTVVSPALALQQEADTVYALPAIEVNALRIPAENLRAPVRISTLDRETIESTFSTSVSELLDRAGSMFVRQYGNGLANLSFRGTSSSQTLILLDGIPLYDPQLGQIDLSIVPTAVIQESQILHGQASSLFGSQSLGGVVHLKSLQSNEPFFLQTSGLSGPYGERAGQLTTGFTQRSIRGLIAFSHSYEQGDFPYLNVSLFPPQTSRREGADRTLTSIFGKASINHKKSSTSFSGWHNDTARGLPSTATTTPKGERQWDQNSRLQASHITSLSTGLLTVNGAWQRRSLRYANPQLGLDQKGRTYASTLDATFATQRFPIELSTGITGSFYRANHPNLTSRPHEVQAAWYVNGTLTNQQISLFPAFRVDTFFPSSSSNLLAVSPSLGLNIQPVVSLPLHIKVSVGRAFRAPTFNDRFWQPGGNPALKPEHGWNYEAGAIYRLSHQRFNLSLEATTFLNRIQNQITWLPGLLENANVWTPINIGTTNTTGLESSVASSVVIIDKMQLSASADYTLANSRDVTSADDASFNQPLRYVPRHILKTRLGLTAQHRSIRWHIDAGYRYTSERFVTTDGQQSIPAYSTADVSLRLTKQNRRANYTLGLFLENAMDKSYEIIKGYPVPPRALRIQLTLRFSGTS